MQNKRPNCGLKYQYIIIPIIIIGSFLVTTYAHAATLAITPSSAQVAVGNVIEVKVLVNSNGDAINTSAATIQFPPGLLQVMSVSDSQSIFSLWVQNPTFSNSNGTITFTGGVPNPGFIGQNGRIMSVVFRALKAGNASLIFTNASVLKNDGLGTEDLTGTQQGTIVINAVAQSPTTKPTVSSPTLTLPVISSASNPDHNAWYSNTSASFSWSVPAGVTSVETILSKDPNAVPTTAYDSSVSQRTFDHITDGVWYFNLRYINASGASPIASYKIHIDATAPQAFTPTIEADSTGTNITVNATDTTSGIDAYSIAIDGRPTVRIPQSVLVNNRYTAPIEGAGDHDAIVTAYDKAGNSTQSDVHFVSPALIAPVVNAVVATLGRGEELTIDGTSVYKNSPVTVFVESEGTRAIRYEASTTSDGSFSVALGKMVTVGSLKISAQHIFSASVESPKSNVQVVTVNDIPLVQTSKTVVYALSYIIPMVMLLIVLILILYVGWHKFFSLRRRLNREAEEAIASSHRTLVAFKDELGRRLKQLEKAREDRELNKKEEKIFAELQADIDEVEVFIAKSIKKIK